MITIRWAVIASAIIALPGPALAQVGAPDMAGTWQVQATAISQPNGKVKEGEPVRKLLDATFEYEIDWHEGPRFSGVDVDEDVDAAMGAVPNERISGVIGPDNKTVHIVDDNGWSSCTIVSSDQLDCIYRHITPTASLVAINIWRRKE